MRQASDKIKTVQKYAESNSKLYMSIADAEILSIELAVKIMPFVRNDIEKKKTIVVGIANGGLMVAWIVAKYLSVPMEIIGIRRSGSSLKRLFGRFKPLVRLTSKALEVPIIKTLIVPLIDGMNELQTNKKAHFRKANLDQHTSIDGKHVVLIDDSIESGRTVEMAREIMKDAGAAKVTIGVITIGHLDNDRAKADQFNPIFYINGKYLHYYPWSQNNAEYDDYLSWLIQRGITPWA